MMQWQLPPGGRPRSPLAQFAVGLIGIALIVGFGLFALGALAVIAVVLSIAYALRRFLPSPSVRPPAQADTVEHVERHSQGNVIDGEFEVVDADRRR